MENCQLCRINIHGLPSTSKTGSYLSQLQQIISSCIKYLSKDIFQVENWNVHPYANLFCDECAENTHQLLQLDIKLEQIHIEIKQLIDRITEKVSRERQKDQFSSPGPGSIHLAVASSFLPLNVPSRDAPLSLPLEGHAIFDDGQVTMSSHVSYDLFEENSLTPNLQDLDESTTTQGKFGHPEETKRAKKVPKAGAPRKPKNVEGNNGAESNSEHQNERVETKITKNVPKDVFQTKLKNVKGATEMVIRSEIEYETVDDGFVCKHCNKKFTRMNLLNKHNCDSQTTSECHICGKSFSSHGSLQLHLLIHSGEKRHKCEICGKTFLLPHHLRLHLKTHSAQKHKCDICEKDFKDISYLKKHKEKHTTNEEERRKFSCDICQKRFTLKQTLTLHLIQHTKNSKHKCDVCGKLFPTSSGLRKHGLTHSEGTSFKCPHCYKSFRSKFGRNTHILSHKTEKAYQCDQCGKSYFSQRSLSGHIYHKHNVQEGNYICDICGKNLKTQLQLKSHIKNHEYRKSKLPGVQPYKCTVCERAYSDERGLIDHQQVVHIVTTVNKFPCDKCGFEFEDYVEYRNHYRIRGTSNKTAVFKFKCYICNETFHTRCNMILHFNTNHTESEFPYKCSKCGRGFLLRNDMWKHRKLCDVKPKAVAKIAMKKVKKKGRKSADEESDDCESDFEQTLERSINEKNSGGNKLRRSQRVKRESTCGEESDQSDPNENENSTTFISGSGYESPEYNKKDCIVEVKVEPWIKEETEYDS